MREAALSAGRTLRVARAFPIWVGLAYALALILVLTAFNGVETGPTFFPGAGITLAALVLTSRRRWPAILVCVAVAEYLVDVTHALSPAQAIGFALANCAEPLTGALLLRGIVGRVDLARRRDLVAFFGCAVLAGPAVGALVALANTTLNGGAPQDDVRFLLRWILGDGLGVLAVGAAILVWDGDRMDGRHRSRRLGVLLGAGAVVSTALIFWINAFPLAYVPAVLLIWVAFELGSRGVALVGAGMAMVIAFAVAEGRHFWSRLGVDVDSGWLYIQVLLAVVIGVALLLAVEIRERERSVLERNRSVALLGLQRAVAAIAAARTTEEVIAAVVSDGSAAAGSQASGLVVREGTRMRLMGGEGLAGWVLDGWGDFPADPAVPIADAVLSGVPVLLHDLADVAERYPAVTEVLARSRGGAWAAVPFPPTTPTPGGMFYHFEQPQAFGEDHVAVLSTLAETAGQALARAYAHEREHQLAVDLQTSMLPASTLSTPQVQVAARYRTADAHLQVGGDWYDTVQLPDGRIGLAIGDVVGHSLEAATAMGQLRSAAAALALTVRGPAELLTLLEAFADRIPAAGLCTLAYLELDPGTGVLRHASAGHPPVVVRRPDGSVSLLDDGRSLPLGAVPAAGRATRSTGELVLEPGTDLVLYTDGLVERRGESIGDGLDRLVAGVSRHGGLAPERLCDALIAELLTEEPRRDDVALMCVAYRPDGGHPAPALK